MRPAPGPGRFEAAPGPDGPGGGGGPGPPDLLAESGSFVRVVGDGQVLRAAGDVPDEGLPDAQRAGFRDGRRGRRQVAHAHDRAALPPGFRGALPSRLIQFGADAGPLEDRIDSMQRRVALISVLGIGLTVLLASVLAGPALAPLSRLRRSVAGVTTTRDLSRRLPERDAGREVDELAHGVNEMLARLESSSSETERALEATRRFAGDVGHEVRTPLTSMRANIDAVRRNPSMPEAERRAILDDVAREQEDLVAVLDALQALARGDAAAALPREPVDMAEVVDAAVEAARRRHPEAHVELSAAEGEHLITGWPDGLRLLVDNLIENAIRHGGSRVDRAASSATTATLLLTVEDDGPGIPAAERERMFERFTRGAQDGGSPGSGLGLALVAQQAQLHGGDVTVGDSAAGGARLTGAPAGLAIRVELASSSASRSIRSASRQRPSGARSAHARSHRPEADRARSCESRARSRPPGRSWRGGARDR